MPIIPGSAGSTKAAGARFIREDEAVQGVKGLIAGATSSKEQIIGVSPC